MPLQTTLPLCMKIDMLNAQGKSLETQREEGNSEYQCKKEKEESLLKAITCVETTCLATQPIVETCPDHHCTSCKPLVVAQLNGHQRQAGLLQSCINTLYSA